MADRENVIKGLECCYKYETNIASGLVCEECPYNINNDLGPCTALLHRDTLELLKEQKPDNSKYEYKYDHTDCLWYGSDNWNQCPSTCSQYRDGWNDAMDYIFKDGRGYHPYKRR